MKPILIKTDPVSGTQYEHPAYGMISYGRVNGRTKLVGSELQHQNFIHLEIETAKKWRNHHSDKFYADKTVVEIYLTEQQWATFISSPNTSGVPCTFRRKPASNEFIQIPSLEEEDKHELAKQELKEYAKEISKDLVDEVIKLKKLLTNPTVKKTELAAIVKALDLAVQGINSNMPFHVDQHKEFMEENLSSAKSEIEGYINNKIYSLGLSELQKVAPTISFNEPTLISEE